MKFPMSVQHRNDPHSMVVVSSQEQYDELPEEFKPQLVSGQTGDVPKADVQVADDLAARSAELDKAEHDFAEHVRSQMLNLDELSAKVHADQLQLAAERAEFEAQRMAAIPAPEPTAIINGVGAELDLSAAASTPAVAPKRGPGRPAADKAEA